MRNILYRIMIAVVMAGLLSSTICYASGYDDFVKKHKSAKGFTNIYKDGDDIYLELTDSLLGRRVMLSTVISKSPTPTIPAGQELSKSNVYQIEKRDSAIIFYSCIEPASASMLMPAIANSFPIKYNGENSVIINITKLFDPSNEDVLDLNGLTIGNGAIYDAYYQSDKSLVKSIRGYSKSVGVERELTFELSLAEKMLGLTLADKPLFTCTSLTTLSLLPSETINTRKADSRIGVRAIEIESFPEISGKVNERIVSRWNLTEGKKIRIHFDPNIPAAWINAISDGILEWNSAFEKIGLGKVIEVLYDANSVYLMDPMICSVSLGESSDMALAARLTTDKTTGEILGFHIQVPGDWVTGIRRATSYSIGDIDKRFAGYNLSSDAIYDVMKAQSMSIFCHCLGLQRNYAGSYAYSPSELSDDSFTSSNGFLSSVTDDVLFNWYANPDSPKQSIIADRIGPYDYYAIEWLYKDFVEETDNRVFDELIKSHEGDPRYLFVASTNVKTDSRSLQGDFSNDALDSFEKGMNHLRSAVSSWEWLLDDSIPEEYAYLWADWAWLRLSSLITNLSYQVGSFVTNDPKSGLDRYVAVPKETQKKAVQKIFDSLRDLSWLDSQKNLLLIAGANKDASGFTNANLFSASKLSGRLQVLSMATRLGANGGYTPDEFLSDLQKNMLVNASKGKLNPSEETSISMYLTWLMSFSDLAKSNYKAATGGKSLYLSGENEDAISSPDIIYEDKASLEVLCYASLKKAKVSLTNGMSICKDSVTKGRIKYLISMIDAALEGNK